MTLVNGSLMRAESLLAPLFSPSWSSPSRDKTSPDSSGDLPNTGVVCRKSQTVISASPVNVFLALMNTADGEYFWPQNKGSSLKVKDTNSKQCLFSVSQRCAVMYSGAMVSLSSFVFNIFNLNSSI